MCSEQQLELGVIHGGHVSVEPSAERRERSRRLTTGNRNTGSNTCNVVAVELPPAILNKQITEIKSLGSPPISRQPGEMAGT